MPDNIQEKIKAHAKQADEGWGLGYGFFSKVINDHNLKKGAEVGVAFGGHSEAILKNTKIDKLYGVDPYKHDKSYQDAMNLPQKEFDELYRFTVSRLSPFGQRYQHIRKPSVEAALEAPDCLDFIYLDGDHSYKGVFDDLCAWFSKIREGGIIGGHDYDHITHPGVKKAVDEFFRRFGWKINVEGQGVWWVKKEPLFISFFMPAYNCENFIAESVESIMKGNFSQGDELIIVNDGSTDNTVKVIEEIKTKYPEIKIFHHDLNKGGAQARNTAISYAKNSLLFCLDSDNILIEGSIKRLKDFLLNSGADVAAFYEMRYFNNETKQVTGKWEFPKKWITLEYYLSGEDTPGYGGNYLFTKESWQRAGGYPIGNWLDTWGFGLRQLATESRMAILKDSYYLHRHGHNSYYQRESKGGTSSKAALENLQPFFNLIRKEDVEYITSNKDSWFEKSGKHPLKLNKDVQKHFYERDNFIDTSLPKKSLKRTIKEKMPYLVNLYMKAKGFYGNKNKENISYSKTSISEGDKRYLDICNLASVDEKIFNSFRSNLAYKEIVETVSQKQGERYLKMIIAKNPELLDHFDEFRKNDLYGGPELYDYGKFGKFAPTTLRYIKVLSDLKNLFGSLDNMNIIEIGIGYGGQCKIISDAFKVASYTLVDLEGPLKLAEKYLNNLQVKNIKFVPFNELKDGVEYDLLISNYAFSECERSIQDMYFEKAFKKSKRGYLLWNFLAKRDGIDTYDIEELQNKIKGSMVIPAKPYSFSENRILFFDHTRKVFSQSNFYADRLQVFFENIISDIYGNISRFLQKYFPKIYYGLKKIIRS